MAKNCRYVILQQEQSEIRWGHLHEIQAPACNFDLAMLKILDRPEWRAIISGMGPTGVGIMGAALLQIGIPRAFDEQRTGLARFNAIAASLLGLGMMIDSAYNMAGQPAIHTGDFQVLVNSLAQMGVPDQLANAVPIGALGIMVGNSLYFVA